MTAVAYNPPLIAEFRNQLRIYGIKISSTSAWEVLRVVLEKGGDSDLAITAMLMQPRPDWLQALIDVSNAR